MKKRNKKYTKRIKKLEKKINRKILFNCINFKIKMNITTALLSFSILCMQISTYLHYKTYKIEYREIKDRLNFLELKYYLLKNNMKVE